MKPADFLIVQCIETCWTKVSRGAPGATSRNAVPQLLPLRVPDELTVTEEAAALHHVVFSEAAGFSEPSHQARVVGVSSLPSECGISVESSGASLAVSFVGPKSRPREHPRQAFVLQPTEWGQLVYNWRVPEERTWSYHKRAVNIGFRCKSTEDLFQDSKAAHTFESLNRLA